MRAPIENITYKPLQNPPPHSTTRPKGLVYLALRFAQIKKMNEFFMNPISLNLQFLRSDVLYGVILDGKLKFQDQRIFSAKTRKFYRVTEHSPYELLRI